MHTIDITTARRLALAQAGLLSRRWSRLPRRAAGGGRRARQAAHDIVRRFGYLQVDSVSVAGARSHTLVMLSRLEGFAPHLGEDLLKPGEPLFEYWGHEASWLPIELYPIFGFRREEFRVHPWWGDLLGEHPQLTDQLLRRISDDGPLRSLDLEEKGRAGWWDLGVSKKVLITLWSRGDLAIRQRSGFQRTYDLTERVIDDAWRDREVDRGTALRTLLLKALDGHGWATQGTLAATWRLRRCRDELVAALEALREQGHIVPCQLVKDDGRKLKGWIRPQHLELGSQLRRLRPDRSRGVLLSPFDPVLWDRRRVDLLFGFEQLLEIFKPAPERRYGYYCLPVLSGEHLVGRVDLKAHRRNGTLQVVSRHVEDVSKVQHRAAAEAAIAHGLDRYAKALGLELVGV